MGWRKLLLAVAVCLGLLGLSLSATAQAAANDLAGLDQLLARVKSYKLGDSRQPLEQVQAIVIKAATSAEERPMVAKKIAGLLDGEASFEAKDFACRQLYIIGTPAEVSQVAQLLPDEKLSHMGRYVLEAMADPAADAALRQAMETLKGKLLIGVVNSLGNRRDAASLPAMKELLANPDPALASAAAAALGKIGGPDAVAALAACLKSTAAPEVKGVATDAYLLCADDTAKLGRKAEAAAIYEEMRAEAQPLRIRLAALRGLTAAQPQKAIGLIVEALKGKDPAVAAIAASFARQLPGDDATKAFVAALPTIPVDNQVYLIDALAARGDAAAKPAVLKLIASQNAAVRTAAIRAMASIGSASEVGVLAEAAAKGTERDAAREALASLKGANVDQAIASALVSGDAEVRAELVNALASRRAMASMPTLADLSAKDAAENVRVAALKAIGTLGADAEVPVLVDRLTAAKADADRNAAKDALSSISTRLKDRETASAPIIAAVAKSTGATKATLIGVLSQFGGAKALETVTATLKDADASIQDASVRALTTWTDAAAIPTVMRLAQSDDQKQRVLALRGMFQLMAKPGAPAGGDALNLYKQMLTVASRPEDKKIVLAGLGNLKGTGALNVVMSCIDDASVRPEAAAAAIRIAKAIGPRQPAARAALQKIADNASIDETLRTSARQAMNGR